METATDIIGAIAYGGIPVAMGASLLGRAPRVADVSQWLYAVMPATVVMMSLSARWASSLFFFVGLGTSVFLLVILFALVRWIHRSRFLVSTIGKGQEHEVLRIVEGTLRKKGQIVEHGSPAQFGQGIDFLVGRPDEIAGLAWLGFQTRVSREELRSVRRALRENLVGVARAKSNGLCLGLIATGVFLSYIYYLL